MPSTAAVLPCCTATVIPWSRSCSKRGPPVSALILIRHRVTCPHGRGRVKSNTLTCTPSCVPNQIAGKVCNIYRTQSTNDSRPEHGPESVLRCDRSHPGSWLFHHEAIAITHQSITRVEQPTTRTIDDPSTGNTRLNTVGRHA